LRNDDERGENRVKGVFLLLAALTTAGALGMLLLRRGVHCALCLAAAFIGLAGLYVHLGAEFAGFAQVLVYVGAVAVLVVFVLFLTRSDQETTTAPPGVGRWLSLAVAGAVFLVIAGVTAKSPSLQRLAGTNAREHQEANAPAAAAPAGPPGHTSRAVPPTLAIGRRLMGPYVLPLEVLGLLLTAAVIGAVIIALPERD
jgi:NADH-quinone oxidoreductase subunit J